MKVTANCSFCGEICMAAGETRDMPDSETLQSLIAAGYVTAESREKTEAKPKKKKASA